MYHDNIQEYVSQAAAANFNQANSGYRPPMVSNQIRPPGFPPVQNPHANNQNNFNRGNNFNQNRGNNFNQASTSGSGTLPGNTVTNPKEDLKGITTRSGATIQGPKAVNHDTEPLGEAVQCVPKKGGMTVITMNENELILLDGLGGWRVDWDLPFELMCDASDFAIGAVLGQRKNKHFQPIHYASKTMNEAQTHYTTTEKELLAVVYAFEKFRSYLVMSKSIVYTDHSAISNLFARRMLGKTHAVDLIAPIEFDLKFET
ncbi:reverse transcriptase domain-containing protein [Tanacetum coccineum]